MGYYRTASNDNLGPFTSRDDNRSDLDLAAAVTEAAADLQRAMDAAIDAGLLIEPSFQSAEFRSTNLDSGPATYIVNLQILRKLL